MVKLKNFIAIVALVALLAPATALAQSGVEGYSGDNNVVAGLDDSAGNGGNGGGSTTQAQTVDNGSLPFTGADLGVLAGAGGLLLALGFGLRRLTHRPSAT